MRKQGNTQQRGRRKESEEDRYASERKGRGGRGGEEWKGRVKRLVGVQKDPFASWEGIETIVKVKSSEPGTRPPLLIPN